MMDEIATTSSTVRSFLECQICFEAFKPPIYVCHKGHSICSICIMRVERCPTCRHLYTGTRNFLVENMCETLRVTEEFDQSEGDSTDAAIAEVHNEFRSMTCYLSQNGCQNASVDYFDYIQHLRSHHGVECVVGCAYIRKFEIKDRRVIRGIPSDTFIFNYMNRNFLVIGHEMQGHAWFWVALHGSEEDTKRFRVDMSLGTTMKTNQNCRHEHSLNSTKCVQIGDPFRKWSGRVFGSRSTAAEVRDQCLMVPCGGVHSRLFEASGPTSNGRHLYLAVRIVKVPEDDKEEIVPRLPTFAVPAKDGLLSCCRPPARPRPPQQQRLGRFAVPLRLRLIGPNSSISIFGTARVYQNDEDSIQRQTTETAENPVPETDVPVSTSRTNLSEASSSVLSRLPASRFGSCTIS